MTLLAAFAASAISMAPQPATPSYVRQIPVTSFPGAMKHIGNFYVFKFSGDTWISEYDVATQQWYDRDGWLGPPFVYSEPYTELSNAGGFTFYSSWGLSIWDSAGKYGLGWPHWKKNASAPSKVSDDGLSVFVTCNGTLYERPLSPTGAWKSLGNGGAFVEGRPAVVYHGGGRYIFVIDNLAQLHRADDPTGQGIWTWVTPNLPKDANGTVIFQPAVIGDTFGNSVFITGINLNQILGGVYRYYLANNVWEWQWIGHPKRQDGTDGSVMSPPVLATNDIAMVIFEESGGAGKSVAKFQRNPATNDWTWQSIGSPPGDKIRYRSVGFNYTAGYLTGWGEGTLTGRFGNANYNSVAVGGTSGDFWLLKRTHPNKWDWHSIGHP